MLFGHDTFGNRAADVAVGRRHPAVPEHRAQSGNQRVEVDLGLVVLLDAAARSTQRCDALSVVGLESGEDGSRACSDVHVDTVAKISATDSRAGTDSSAPAEHLALDPHGEVEDLAVDRRRHGLREPFVFVHGIDPERACLSVGGRIELADQPIAEEDR